MASAVSALGSSSNSTSTSTAGALDASTDDDQQVFLQLLVSQLQNQDPLNPTDSTQFVSELAQFSELEQVIAIRSDIESYASQAESQAAANPATPATNTGADTAAGQTEL
jgi:flagellar basal-body rod modification protein FlgD